MCSHDLHIGQYTQCPFLILFTCFPLPTQHAKMSANYSHLSYFFKSLIFFNFLKELEVWTAYLLDKDHTYEHFTVQDGRPKKREQTEPGGER